LTFGPGYALFVCLVLLTPFSAGAADKAGEVTLAHGVVTAHTANSAPRLVGTSSVLYEGDVVTTAARSVAQLKLSDGTRITLRPGSSFQIETFNAAPGSEQGIMTLFKGGLRAVTGFMSKRNQNAMRLRTPVATIGIRGTEFDARLCAEDCAQEAAVRPSPAGRAGFVKGNVQARSARGHARSLTTGGAVYNGDTLITEAGAYAVVAFRDQSRVTLLPSTEFKVDRVEFDAQAPARGTSWFNLVRGGLRAVSGLVGKRGRGYQMRTAVATIGIRGTLYDALCVGACLSATPAPGGDGLYVKVWDGAIVFDDIYDLDAGNSAFLGNTGLEPTAVADLPQPITEPQPNTLDLPEPPPAPSSTAPEDGLYVSCYSGLCAVETPGNTVELEEGEAGFVGEGGGAANPLDEVPPFQADDPVLHAVDTGGAMGDLTDSLNNGGRECAP
jgi:hypothetical protein